MNAYVNGELAPKEANEVAQLARLTSDLSKKRGVNLK